MPLLDVKGVQVSFPFEPYACQVTYMEKVMECLQKNVNGILESPTGTGKTLCLLCSSLAWLESRKAQTELSRQVSLASIMGEQQNSQSDLDRLSKSLQSSTGLTWGGSDFSVPKIIYASRTHSQLTQAVQELKRTAYNSVKVSVIGSREQLCIHEQVRKETNNANKVHMCRAKVNARTCHMYNRLEEIKRNSDARALIGNVVDIEDMITYGEKQRVCPYYMARELKNDADIIFMPYNYLLDPRSRKAHGVELQGNIIIFDEAHNLEKICEDSSSFDLTSTDLATAIEELKKLSEKIFEMTQHESQSLVEMTDSSSMPEPEFTLEDLLRLKAMLTDLEEKIDAIEVPGNGKGVTKAGIYIFELLSSVSIGFDTKSFIIDLLDKVINYISQDGLSGFSTKGAGLTKFCDVLKIIFSRDMTEGGSLHLHKANLARSYKVHIQEVQSNKKFKKISSWTSNTSEKMGKTLSYWCFSPGHSMADLMAHDVKCVILTSGTLSPLSSFTMEMQIPFPVTLENPHVIEKHQVWIGTVNKGPDGVTLNSNFETRYTSSYQASLGNSIVNFSRVTPNGLLIFFPSYPVMDKCIEYWKENNIYNRISQYKPVFVEPKGKMDFQDAMFEFYEKIRDPSLNGAIFIAVCRGKVSEGLDFADENGRAVVITGLPYPPYMDPKVVLKMQFLDEVKKSPGIKTLTGKEWYRQQASRAVNQAIGRVIRHRQDFGAILLCDTRFSSPDSISQLPIWVRPHVNKCLNFGQALKDIMVFFKTAEQKMPAPKPKKRINASSSQGAYFMPTITKNVRPSDVMKARTVSDHVSSLAKPTDDGTNVAKLCVQYEGGTTDKVSASESKKGLLGALQESEATPLDDSYDTAAYKHTKNNAVYNKQNKKKITIKRKETMTEKSCILDNIADKPAKVKSIHLYTAESYIAEVKKILPSEKYKMFSKALIDYKKQGNLQQLTPVLVGLFTEDPQNYPFFKEFYRFVRPKDKYEFDKLCKNITGIGCGYKPEDSVSKKRLLSDDSGAPEKRQKISQLTVNKVCNTLEEVNNSKEVKEPTDTNQNDNENKIIDTLNQSTDLFPQLESSNTDRLKEYEDKILKADAIPCASKYPSGYTCEKCQKTAERPFEAGCGHICCFPCWRNAFDTNKLCPVCNAKVRRRHLVAKYFTGPDLD